MESKPGLSKVSEFLTLRCVCFRFDSWRKLRAWLVSSGSEWHSRWTIMYIALKSSEVGARKLRKSELYGSSDAFACDQNGILISSLATFLLDIFICIPSLPVFPFLTFWTPLYLKHSQIIYLVLFVCFWDCILMTTLLPFLSSFPYTCPTVSIHNFNLSSYHHGQHLIITLMFMTLYLFTKIHLIFSQPWYIHLQ